MRVIARSTLKAFADGLAGTKDHSAVKAALDSWYHEVCCNRWKSSADVKRLYATASIINAERIVFNIKGNDYRLVATVDYKRSTIWIKWLGSHRDYDRIDVAEVSYEH